jgi:HAD superfamily hydrolase (TIGR01490 family)
MRLAIFDFDGTLLGGNSWQLFFWWSVRHQPARAPRLLLGLALRRLRLVSERFLQEQVLAAWRGRTRDEMAALGRRVYAERLGARLRPAALRELADRRAAGYEVVLVTGAFDFLVAPLVQAQGITRWAATPLVFADGRCTGRIDGPALRGPEKRRALLALAAGAPVAWADSCAFGDALEDLPVLELVGEPVLVHAGAGPPRGLPPAVGVRHWGG